MNRHFRRARSYDGGFTFVELLVTIIIAGIAFAAMVPVFVGAQKASSGDIVRNGALQLAQDKLEKIRGLDYDLIDQTALTNNTVPNNLFGTNVSWSTGGGGSRQFTVAYKVDFIDKNGNAGATPGLERYKQVTITVRWNAPPNPVKPVVLSTMVSQQYAGPQIMRVDLGPNYVLETDTTTNKTSIIGGPLVIDVHLAAEDILSMNQGAAEQNRGFVEFTITPLNGTSVADQKVTLPVSVGDPGHYQFSWDNSGASNGVYVIQAVAVAGIGSRSQGMPWSLALDFVNNAPPPPTSLQAIPYDARVQLTWSTAAVGAVDHYEMFRSTDGVTFTHLADTTAPDSYVDATVTNGVTYYYKVRTVDANHLTGALSDAVSATPVAPADTTAPSVPSPLTATADVAQPTVHLVWTASVGPGNPASPGYIVERQRVGSATWERLQTLYQATLYDDTTAGWSSSWTYRVYAVDVAGNASGYATAGPVTTVAVVLRQIKVTNNSNLQSYVWVQNVATSQWYTTAGAGSATPPGGVWVKKNGNSATWSNLPSGDYNVYYMKTNSFMPGNQLKYELVHTGSGNGTSTYP